MKSYEKEVNDKIENEKALPPKLDLSLLRYFWQAGPFSGRNKKTIPKFLRKIEVLKTFTDNELRILSKYLHLRQFEPDEAVFEQGDLGVGFYFVYSGQIDIRVQYDEYAEQIEDASRKLDGRKVLSLEQYDYFGELALLQENNFRTAAALSRDNSQLLGIFKPDLEVLIDEYPIVATKLLQSISVILANRLFSITSEVRTLKMKIANMEENYEKLREGKGEEEK